MQAFIFAPSTPSAQPAQPGFLGDRLKQQLLAWGNCPVHDLSAPQELGQMWPPEGEVEIRNTLRGGQNSPKSGSRRQPEQDLQASAWS